jgi:quaternary ammonium compound-resistance protein SugE
VAWTYLILAGLLEIVWAYYMKKANGFTDIIATSITLVAMIISFSLLAAAMRSLPLGTAYTVWVGIGAIGTFAIGILWLNEAVNPTRFLAAGLIFAGIVLMKLSSTDT